MTRIRRETAFDLSLRPFLRVGTFIKTCIRYKARDFNGNLLIVLSSSLFFSLFPDHESLQFAMKD